ncbi:hypothetical protein CYLTODRAFT_449311 [Cylindrobasidium torrendii FP15055 ss-10]|uniref:Zn(2)-C6 fungal-type domain-containing protein n=1 Tax=Cylindrobasidium torrendii FP15055 ss-10 TaxID=1314674 RepID=A0A0D7BU09_9AGAR|nr:hypothetical protein CYLTODRAFT_449311 [Cylindrobasidium torrendii FP15055 ss-10]
MSSTDSPPAASTNGPADIQLKTVDVDGDHRKKRRNRTTQSCMNCHSAKRMCDRKRPACARCVQLGIVNTISVFYRLLGLTLIQSGDCVYEVDDPNQRAGFDENARLVKRISELETVVRELKHKPHLRRSNTLPDTLQGCIASTGIQCGPIDSPPIESDTPLSRRSKPRRQQRGTPYTCGESSGHSEASSSNTMHLNGSPRSVSSSTTGASTPLEEFDSPLGSPVDGIGDLDLNSIFPDYIPGSASILQAPDFHQLNQSDHCGCLHDRPCYNALLELSLRLRKAADVMAMSHRHQSGAHCQMQRRVAELDAVTSASLGNVVCPPADNNSYAAPLRYHAPPQMHSFGTVTGRQISHPPGLMPTVLHSSSSSTATWDGYLEDVVMHTDSAASWKPAFPTSGS